MITSLSSGQQYASWNSRYQAQVLQHTGPQSAVKMTVLHSLKIWRTALKGLTMAHYSHLLCWPNGPGDIPQYRLFITGIWEKNSIKSYCTLCWPVFRWTFIWNGKTNYNRTQFSYKTPISIWSHMKTFCHMYCGNSKLSQKAAHFWKWVCKFCNPQQICKEKQIQKINLHLLKPFQSSCKYHNI